MPTNSRDHTCRDAVMTHNLTDYTCNDMKYIYLFNMCDVSAWFYRSSSRTAGCLRLDPDS